MTESQDKQANHQRPIRVGGHVLSAKAAQRVTESRARAVDRLQSKCGEQGKLIVNGQFVAVDMVETHAKSIRRKSRWMLLDIALLYVGMLGIAAFGLLILAELVGLGK